MLQESVEWCHRSRGFLECLVHHDDSGQVDVHIRIGDFNVVSYLTNCRNHARFSVASSMPGSSTVMLIAVTRASGEINRLSRAGSSSAAALIRERSISVRLSGSSTRGATSRSSPIAVVCWKLVSESTRIEKWDPPGPFCNIGNSGKYFGGENLAIPGREDDQRIVVLAENILQFLKSLQMCIFASKKDSIVIRKSEKLTTRGDAECRAGVLGRWWRHDTG